MKLASAPKIRLLFIFICTFFFSISAQSAQKVSAFAYDRHTGQSRVCQGFTSSTDAESCATTWCRTQQISRKNCGIVHCVFWGWNAVAIGQDTDANSNSYFHIGEGCGSRTKAEAKELALRRCEADHLANCELTALYFIE
jgi:hypothetical protein